MPIPTTWREVPALADTARTLSVMFRHGTRFTAHDPALRFTVSRLEPGALSVPTGELLVCDPFNVRGARSFPVQVPAGRHTVVLSRAVSTDEATGTVLQDRIAGAMLWLQPGDPGNAEAMAEPARWSAVKVPARGGVVGFGVDSGLACFTDRRAADTLTERYPEGGRGIDGDNGPDGLAAALRGALAADVGFKAGALRLGKGDVTEGPADLWLFESGRGDGRYVTHLGFTSAGTIACVAVDLGVLYEAPAGPGQARRPLESR